MCMFGKISVIWEIQFPWFLFAGISFFFSSSRMSGHNISLHTSQVTQGPWPGSCGLEQFTDLMVCPFISDFFLSLKMSLSWLLLRIKECWNKSPKCQEKNKMYLSLNKKSVKKKKSVWVWNSPYYLQNMSMGSSMRVWKKKNDPIS